MTIIDPTKVTLGDALAAIRPLQGRFAAAVQARPGSRAARDGRNRIGRHALELACTGISVGLEHLDTVRVVIEDARILTPFAPITLIRTAIEGCVKARWLLEQGITADARLERGVAAQRADYDERRKFEDAAGTPEQTGPQFKTARERIAELEKTAKSLGITIRKPPDRVRLFDLYLFPGMESRVEGSKLGGVLYRLVSGPAHAMQWSLITGDLDLQPLEELGQYVTRLASVTMKDETAAVAIMVGVLAARDGLDDLEAYTGPP